MLPATLRVRADSYRVRMLQERRFGILIGFGSSFLGNGGGIFQVPLMIGSLGFPTAIATVRSSGEGMITGSATRRRSSSRNSARHLTSVSVREVA